MNMGEPVSIIEIENTLLTEIKSVTELMKEYNEISMANKRMGEAFNPFTLFKKRDLTAQIKRKFGVINDSIGLFVDMHQGKEFKQFDETLIESNKSIQKLAKDVVSMAQEYIKLRGKDNDIDWMWLLLQYQLKDQDVFTENYNKETTEPYFILSILEEIKKASSGLNIPENIFTSRSYPRESEITGKKESTGKTLRSRL